MTTALTPSVHSIGIAEIEARYSPGIGRHWFDRSAMRFFRTRLPQAGYEGPGGVYFVSSEQYQSGPRLYTVRKLVGAGNILTIGDFNSMSKGQANGMAKRLAAGTENAS